MGVALALLAACCWAMGAVFARLGLQSQHMKPPVATAISLVVGAIVLSAIVLLVSWDDILALSAVAFGWFALLGFIQYPVGRLLDFSSVRLAGVARATPVIATAPIFAVGWAIALGGETLRAVTLVGTLLIVFGIGLMASERPKA